MNAFLAALLALAMGGPVAGVTPTSGPMTRGPTSNVSTANAPNASRAKTPETCTYRSYQWSKAKRRAVNHQRVNKPYAEVNSDERDPDDARCSVCEEDQVEVSIKGLPTVTVCWAHMDKIRASLTKIRDDKSFKIKTLTGYRPGKTRGPYVGGMRSVWSNHSYGTAIDINAKENGLHRSCSLPPEKITPANVAKRCRASVGGPWDPRKRPLTSIVREGVVYKAMTTIARWRWGGEIAGRIKDFMHFSLTGY